MVDDDEDFRLLTHIVYSEKLVLVLHFHIYKVDKRVVHCAVRILTYMVQVIELVNSLSHMVEHFNSVYVQQDEHGLVDLVEEIIYRVLRRVLETN